VSKASGKRYQILTREVARILKYLQMATLLRPARDRRTSEALTGLLPEHEEQCRAERD
jgi:hypothetical protein